MFQKFTSTILGMAKLTDSVKQLTLSTPEEFTFLPGQFITLLIPDGERTQRRSYSIASAPRTGEIDLCVKKVEGGNVSCYLHDLKEGDTLNVMGPLGHFIVKEEVKGPVVFVSTGTGISPFVSMIPSLVEEGRDVTLLTGYRNEVLYDDFFSALEEEHESFTYRVTLSRPAEGYAGLQGRVQALVEEVQDTEETHYYLCGLWEMIKETAQLLASKGVPKTRIHFERYD